MQEIRVKGTEEPSKTGQRERRRAGKFNQKFKITDTLVHDAVNPTISNRTASGAK